MKSIRRKFAASGRAMAVAVAAVALIGIAYNHSAVGEEGESSAPGKIEMVSKNKIATAHCIFDDWKFTDVHIDREGIGESYVNIEVNIQSFDSKIEKRNHHLMEEEFFHVEKYPTATIKIHDVSATEGEGNYHGKIDLNIRGVEKTLDLDFNLTDTNPMQVSGEVVILRTDFGIGEPYKRLNPMSIEDEVPLTFSATLPAG